MIFSRHIYWTILLRILLILATSGTGLWLIISQRGIIIGMLLIICSLFQIGGIVTYLNNINRKLRLFFDAIEDRDNTFSYPEQGINEEQQQLNRSLNRINALLAQTKMDYETGTFLPVSAGESTQRNHSLEQLQENNLRQQHSVDLTKHRITDSIFPTGKYPAE